MIITGLIKTSTPNALSPAIIKDGIIYSYDFGLEVMVAKKNIHADFVVFKFVEEDYALAWWHQNMKIAREWVTGESKDASPKFDRESLKAIPSKIVPDWTKPQPDLRR